MPRWNARRRGAAKSAWERERASVIIMRWSLISGAAKSGSAQSSPPFLAGVRTKTHTHTCVCVVVLKFLLGQKQIVGMRAPSPFADAHSRNILIYFIISHEEKTI